MPQPTAEQLATAATRISDLQNLPQPLRAALSHTVRECGATIRRGLSLPLRVHHALGEVVTALNEIAEAEAAPNGIEFP